MGNLVYKCPGPASVSCNVQKELPFARGAMSLAISLPLGPLEIVELALEPCESPTSAIDACLVSPSTQAIVLTSVPPLACVDRPLELAIAAATSPPRARLAAPVARSFSSNASLTIVIGAKGQPRTTFSVPVSMRPSGDSWVIRALIRPATWADAGSISLESVALAGQPLACDCLPARLRVLYH